MKIGPLKLKSGTSKLINLVKILLWDLNFPLNLSHLATFDRIWTTNGGFEERKTVICGENEGETRDEPV